jgi:hypothetical protein
MIDGAFGYLGFKTRAQRTINIKQHEIVSHTFAFRGRLFGDAHDTPPVDVIRWPGTIDLIGCR